MLKIKILAVLRRALNGRFHQGRVFRMNSLHNKFPGRSGRSVVLEDSKGFLGPNDLIRGRLPPETPRMTEPLSFRQIRLVSPFRAPARSQYAGCILQGNRSE